MDSLGEYLKDIRLNLNLSLNQIAKDTNISKKYLEALENEEFSIFPGEAYLKGFLRTYCTYLKLDPDDIINRYEKIKMAETPTPIEQLIPKPRNNYTGLFIAVGIFLLAGALTYFIIKPLIFNKGETVAVKEKKEKKNKEKKDKKESTEGNINKIQAGDKERVLNVKKGDIIQYVNEQGTYKLTVKQISPTVVIYLNEDNELFLIKSYLHEMDINEDQVADLGLFLNFWDDTEANITVSAIDEYSAHLASQDTLKGENPESITTTEQPENINMALKINNNCYIKYQIDDQDPQEGLFRKNALKSLSAEHKLIVWVSNAGAVQFNFDKYNKIISPGDLGQIAVRLIKWVRTDDGQFDLEISSLK